MTAPGRTLALWGLAVVLVAALLAGQAAADGLLPAAQQADTGRLIGRSGFAFLTGIRTYVAAVLWSRLDPIDDRYYSNTTLGQKKFLLPSIVMVTWLDPSFEEPFYAGPYILYNGGQKENAFKLAEEGVRANPRSGFLHASYAQLLLTEKRLPEARREADLAVAMPWRSEGDELNLLATVETIFRQTGAPEKAALVAAERRRLKAKLLPDTQQHEAGD